MNDLFQQGSKGGNDYTAKDIEVLEGLEPVRRRPGMYIGGTDERALHHLFAEVLDNSMDEAVAGHADRIEVALQVDGSLLVTDNGRGIPIDKHPKFKDKSALEVILTTLHSGGKFSDKAYSTAGGLHGVGISVVNALSDRLVVEVARDKELWRQEYSRGFPKGKLIKVGAAPNRRGTSVSFHPDEQIFGKGAHFRPARIFKMARSKAYLYPGVKIFWKCDPELLKGDEITPQDAVLHFPGGLQDYLNEQLEGQQTVTPTPFAGRAALAGGRGQVEWAIHWPQDIDEGWLQSYTNTVPTPDGGTHELGFRAALMRGIKDYAELTNNKKAAQITADDILTAGTAMLSLFIKDPQFQGQTKDKLVTVEAQKLVETAIKDHFDHWLTGAPQHANALLTRLIERAEDRLRRRAEKDVSRKSATRKLRLPGKLADCSDEAANGSEIFIVEGDSAGGSAKQARDRRTQAVLPLRGKILNVASAGSGKLAANQELADLTQALGCGTGGRYRNEDLRYDKVIIMTDADVDGAHIASLLMTFFFREMPKLIEHGHLYLAQPPLYRLSAGGKTFYAMDDADKDKLIKQHFGSRKVEISRFKGLGEMPPAQLKETTMNRKNRVLLRVQVPVEEVKESEDLVERLMGRKPELRFQFIQERAAFATDIDV